MPETRIQSDPFEIKELSLDALKNKIRDSLEAILMKETSQTITYTDTDKLLNKEEIADLIIIHPDLIDFVDSYINKNADTAVKFPEEKRVALFEEIKNKVNSLLKNSYPLFDSSQSEISH